MTFLQLLASWFGSDKVEKIEDSEPRYRVWLPDGTGVECACKDLRALYKVFYSEYRESK